MKHKDKLERLKKSGILVDWEWSQKDWNRMAKFYKNGSWGLFKMIILIPIISLVAIWEYRSEINRNSSNSRRLPMIGTVSISLYCLISFFIWLNEFVAPRPRKNGLPKVIIGKEGVLVGNSFIFWKKKFRLSDVSLGLGNMNQNMIKLTVAWYFGSIKIGIPIPNDKLSDAQTVASILYKEKSKIKGTTQEDLEEFKKSLK